MKGSKVEIWAGDVQEISIHKSTYDEKKIFSQVQAGFMLLQKDGDILMAGLMFRTTEVSPVVSDGISGWQW
jgi:hypothetical protein